MSSDTPGHADHSHVSDMVIPPLHVSDIAKRHGDAAERFDKAVAAVENWDALSPCQGWTAADVFNHVITTEEAFLAGMPGGYQAADGDPSTDGDRAQRWSAVRAALTEALADPDRAGHTYDGYFGPTTLAETVDRFYTLDLIVHRWDLATAAGLRDHARLTDDEIRLVRENLSGLDPAMMRQPGLFGAELAVADDADDQARLLAWLGRSADSW